MSNDYESVEWARCHHAVSAGATQLIEAILHTFERLNAIEYAAPWGAPSALTGERMAGTLWASPESAEEIGPPKRDCTATRHPV